MKKQLLAAAIACGGMVSLMLAAPLSAEPQGNAYGYWAGLLCDHVGPTTGGTTYWESRGYPNRGTCVRLEGQSLARGEWDPADWPI